MKKSNMHRALYDAVSDIDPALIDEVTAPRSHAHGMLRITAAAAAIAITLNLLFLSYLTFDNHRFVSTPGIASVFIYSVNGTDVTSHPLEIGKDVDLPFEFAGTLNIVPGYPLSFSINSTMPITLQISVSHGRFTDWHNDISPDGMFIHRDGNGVLGREFSIQNGRTIYWQPFDDSGKETTKRSKIYVDVILLSDSHIVGYCVLELSQYKSHKGSYCATLLSSEFYPKIDGNFQNVTKAYIDKRILKAKVLN